MLARRCLYIILENCVASVLLDFCLGYVSGCACAVIGDGWFWRGGVYIFFH